MQSTGEVGFLAVTVLLLAAIAVSRASYRLIGPEDVDRDAYAHMLYVADIKSAGHRVPERPSKVVTSGEYAYPYFLHWILSFLPLRWLPTIERFFSPLSDVLLALLLLALYPLGVTTLSETLLVLALFLFTPQFMRFDMAHGKGLSSRKPGLLLTTASLLSFSLWAIHGDPALYALGVLLGALVCLTSKFSVQALVFVLVGFAIGVDPLFALAIPASILLAIGISFGDYWEILVGHLKHLYDFALYKQHKIQSIQRQNYVPPVGEFIRLLRRGQTTDAMELLFDTKPLRIVLDSPFLVVVVVALVSGLRARVLADVPPVLVVWTLTGISTFVLTSLPYLRFIGEGERYLEYTFLPAAVVFVTAWGGNDAWFRLLVVGSAVVSSVVMVLYVFGYASFLHDESERESWAPIRDYLDAKPASVVLLQPVGKSRRLAWQTEHSVVTVMMNEGNSTDEINVLWPSEYGVVTDDVPWLQDQYGPEWVVFEDRDSLPAGSLQPPACEPVVETEHYRLYRFESLTQ